MKLPGEGLRPAVLTPTRASSEPRSPRGRDKTSESAETLTHLVTYGQHQSLGLNGEKGRPNGLSIPYRNSSGRKGPPRTGLNPYTCRSGLSPPSEPHHHHCSAWTVQDDRAPYTRDDSDHSSSVSQHSSRDHAAHEGIPQATHLPTRQSRTKKAPLISVRPL